MVVQKLHNGQSLERRQAWGETHKHPFPLICTKMSPSIFSSKESFSSIFMMICQDTHVVLVTCPGVVAVEKVNTLNSASLRSNNPNLLPHFGFGNLLEGVRVGNVLEVDSRFNSILLILLLLPFFSLLPLQPNLLLQLHHPLFVRLLNHHLPLSLLQRRPLPAHLRRPRPSLTHLFPLPTAAITWGTVFNFVIFQNPTFGYTSGALSVTN
ncbi:hypothetical protein VNO80_04003 [Phaseolus coccineus]|uniref:Uncharacterized protein n=1 Tax=Phaseolus coccineus TaxID=3886 RepID=A0AAN9RNG5_PHACN